MKEGKAVKKFLLIPSYIVMRMCKPFFPESHPWKYRELSYDNWCKYATPMCVEMSTVLGVGFIGIIVLLIQIIRLY
jgi:hypothetical protein